MIALNVRRRSLARDRREDDAGHAATKVVGANAPELEPVPMGGHVRVGLEDNTWFDRGRTVPATNEALVARVVELGRILEREPATPGEARATIGLPVAAAA